MTGTDDSRAEELAKDPESAEPWHAELRAADKREEAWRKRGGEVLKRYRDERDSDTDRRINVLWANTETLKSALFASSGRPDVRRRFTAKGKNNKLHRQVATLLERALSACAESYDMDGEVEAAIEDHLLPGRGQVWLELESEEGEDENEIGKQKAELVHVQWDEFRMGAGKRWRQVPWVARKHCYTRDDLVEKFPGEHAKKIPLELEQDNAEKNDEGKDLFKRAAVWEIWDRATKRRVYVAEKYPHVIRIDDDPYGLRDFFPCPQPLYAVQTTGTMLPIPEYTLYQDQAKELDRLTKRINKLVEAMKRRGVYAADQDQDGVLASLADADDNEFLPVRNWAALMEKGGLANVFMAEDIRPYAEILTQLYNQRQQLIQAIYEITGISDIIRGATNAGETATAQQLKANYGSQRMQKRQKAVHRFVRDAFRIKGELVAEHFSRENLAEMTGIEMPMQAEIQQAQQLLQMAQQQAQRQPQQQMPGAPMIPQAPPIPPQMLAEAKRISAMIPWEEISGILRSDERRLYSIDIETDSTVFQDAEADKHQRMEFSNSVTELMMAVLPAAQSNPQILPFARELVMFMIGGFKVGRIMEETLEDMFDAMASENQAKQAQPQQPPVDPRIEAEAAAAKQEMEINAAKAQADMKAQSQTHQLEMAKGEQTMQIDKAKAMTTIAKAMQPAGGVQ